MNARDQNRADFPEAAILHDKFNWLNGKITYARHGDREIGKSEPLTRENGWFCLRDLNLKLGETV